jgi:hypothetical protein
MSDIVLRRHRLHIRELKVNKDLLQARFPHDCSMTRCTAKCCGSGVWMDLAEHRQIVQHAALIQTHMSAPQEKDPARWFEDEWEHEDFPSGHAIGTAVHNDACVFLGPDRRCVLQKASSEATGNLKPFYCVAFPITVDEGELRLDEPKDPACCTPVSGGPLTVFDVCGDELKYVLGEAGVSELEDCAKRC